MVASNGFGPVEGPAATLKVVPLILNLQPTNQLLYSGDTLSVAVQGPGPWTYRWFFEGAELPGETNSTLVLSGLVTNHPGAYSVSVSNMDDMVNRINAKGMAK